VGVNECEESPGKRELSEETVRHYILPIRSKEGSVQARSQRNMSSSKCFIHCMFLGGENKGVNCDREAPDHGPMFEQKIIKVGKDRLTKKKKKDERENGRKRGEEKFGEGKGRAETKTSRRLCKIGPAKKPEIGTFLKSKGKRRHHWRKEVRGGVKKIRA